MAITRTPIFDDDGSGSTGTIINDAWKQELYDQIDALAAGTTPPAGSSGGVPIVNSATRVLRLAPASPIVLSGISMPGVLNGQELTIHNLGPASVRIAHEDTGAPTAGDRVTYLSVRGQMLGAGGAVTLMYDTSINRWRMALLMPGAPVAVPYAASDYTASAGTWTVEAGDAVLNHTVQEGALLQWNFRFAISSVSNAGAILYAKLPHGFQVLAGIGGGLALLIRVSDAGAAAAAGVAFPGLPGVTQVSFYATVAGYGFGIATNTTEVQGALRIPIA